MSSSFRPQASSHPIDSIVEPADNSHHLRRHTPTPASTCHNRVRPTEWYAFCRSMKHRNSGTFAFLPSSCSLRTAETMSMVGAARGNSHYSQLSLGLAVRTDSRSNHIEENLFLHGRLMIYRARSHTVLSFDRGISLPLPLRHSVFALYNLHHRLELRAQGRVMS